MIDLKRIGFVISLLFGVSSLTQAQQTSSADYLVLNNLDTLYGTVKYINEDAINRDFYRKIRFTNRDGKRKKFRWKEVLAFSINGTAYQSFWLHQSSRKIMLVNPRYDIDPANGEQYFLKLVHKGKLSQYALEWFDQGNADLSSMALLKKEGDSYFIRADQGILGLKRKVLSAYFADCYELSQAIEQKEIHEVAEVVNFYHSNCTN